LGSVNDSSSIDSPTGLLPDLSPRRHALHVTPPAERSIRDGHPWVYDSSITDDTTHAGCGDLGVIFDRKDRFMAIGLLDPTSPIRVRVLHEGSSQKIDTIWFRDRLREASGRRESLRGRETPTDGFRLVNGESDRFPGMVIDRYAGTLVIKLYTAGWIPHLRHILPHLQEVQPHERIVLRLNRSMRQHPENLHGLSDGQILSGTPLSGPVVFQENGVRFEAEPIDGQKTGFFLDQRDNRARVERISRGKDVLNVFSYTGGFSVYAARGGARTVTSVDISRQAIEATERNLALNRKSSEVARCKHRGIAQDAFEVLETFARDGRRFGVVVLDPPMFAQSAAQVDQALRSYARLTHLGLAVLEKGGTLVQASCSARVREDDFFRCVENAAIQAGRPLHDVLHAGHGIDHPTTFADSAYLKCLFARVP
jgi:23S rRNA (cytosine1962-C5)-methyltransferase